MEKFDDSINDIIRRRRKYLVPISIVIGGIHAYLDSEGHSGMVAEIAWWAGPSVVQGSLEAFVKNINTWRRHNIGSGFIMGGGIAGTSNILGFLTYTVGYEVSRHLSSYG